MVNGLPTSFKLTSEQAGKLWDAAHRILIESEEFQNRTPGRGFFVCRPGKRIQISRDGRKGG
jgi:hypothetical protein